MTYEQTLTNVLERAVPADSDYHVLRDLLGVECKCAGQCLDGAIGQPCDGSGYVLKDWIRMGVSDPALAESFVEWLVGQMPRAMQWELIHTFRGNYRVVGEGLDPDDDSPTPLEAWSNALEVQE